MNRKIINSIDLSIPRTLTREPKRVLKRLKQTINLNPNKHYILQISSLAMSNNQENLIDQSFTIRYRKDKTGSFTDLVIPITNSYYDITTLNKYLHVYLEKNGIVNPRYLMESNTGELNSIKFPIELYNIQSNVFVTSVIFDYTDENEYLEAYIVLPPSDGVGNLTYRLGWRNTTNLELTEKINVSPNPAFIESIDTQFIITCDFLANNTVVNESYYPALFQSSWGAVPFGKKEALIQNDVLEREITSTRISTYEVKLIDPNANVYNGTDSIDISANIIEIS